LTFRWRAAAAGEEEEGEEEEEEKDAGWPRKWVHSLSTIVQAIKIWIIKYRVFHKLLRKKKRDKKKKKKKKKKKTQGGEGKSSFIEPKYE
jgi:hypothetical protein